MIAERSRGPCLAWWGKETGEPTSPHRLVVAPERFAPEPGVSSTSENLLIHGDNLAAPSAIGPALAGQVRCVYLDPPYNTGSSFDPSDDALRSGQEPRGPLPERTNDLESVWKALNREMEARVS